MIGYDIRGSGEAAILFNHSGASGQGWSEIFLEALAATFTVITVDHRGTGYSSLGSDPFSLYDLAADGLAVLQKEGIDNAMVIGTSMGGAVAQEFALAYPEQVTALILLGTFAGMSHYVQADKKVLEIVGNILPQWDKISSVERWQRLLPTIYSPGFLEHNRELAMELELRGGRFTTAETIARHGAAVGAFESYQRLPTMTIPALIIHGTADPSIPVENGKILAGRISGSKYIELKGVGHLPAVEKPLEVAEQIFRFTKKTAWI